MAKDPAFLFYPGDWLGGTIGMTHKQKGCYIDLLILQFNHGPFTEKMAINVLRECADEWEELKIKFRLIDGKYINDRLEFEKNKRIAYTESRRSSRKKSNEDSVRIYIVRDNVRGMYKIGSSVNPLRRYNELSNQASPAIMMDIQKNRDISLVWYSEIVERSLEALIHRKFENKRVLGEWFNLVKEDIKWLHDTYNGTYVVRTSLRTENENENRNKDKILNITFDQFWIEYDKKVGDKEKLAKSWAGLTDDERTKAMWHIPQYKLAQPDKKYRKDPSKYLNNKSFNDEIIQNGNTEAGASKALNSRNGGMLISLGNLKQSLQITDDGGKPSAGVEI